MAQVPAPGTVSGTVFGDLQADGTFDAGDPILAGRTVYLDLKNDGGLDPGDPTAVTDGNGGYTLTAPGYGTYAVRVAAYPGESPAAASTVTVVPGQVSPFVNLGLVPGSPIAPLTPAPQPYGTNPDPATAEVTGLYHTILGRAPDAPGLAHWVKLLDGGTSLTQVAEDFLHSTEHETDVVASYYKDFLGRSGSDAEVDAWVTLMRRGMTEEQVSAMFLSSPEYTRLHADDGDFLRSLYANVLGRTASTAEIGAWQGVIGSGSGRAAIVEEFVSSAESDKRAIAGDYATFLGRQGDAAGVDAALASLQGGKLTLIDLAAFFAGSPESVQRAARLSAPAVTLTNVVTVTYPEGSGQFV